MAALLSAQAGWQCPGARGPCWTKNRFKSTISSRHARAMSSALPVWICKEGLRQCRFAQSWSFKRAALDFYWMQNRSLVNKLCGPERLPCSLQPTIQKWWTTNNILTTLWRALLITIFSVHMTRPRISESLSCLQPRLCFDPRQPSCWLISDKLLYW